MGQDAENLWKNLRETLINLGIPYMKLKIEAAKIRRSQGI